MIHFEKLKYLKNKWIIDVCRGPVHIKHDKGSIEVIKRNQSCSANPKSEFCTTLSNIESIIQDDGLIFAEGEKGLYESELIKELVKSTERPIEFIHIPVPQENASDMLYAAIEYVENEGIRVFDRNGELF